MNRSFPPRVKAVFRQMDLDKRDFLDFSDMRKVFIGSVAKWLLLSPEGSHKRSFRILGGPGSGRAREALAPAPAPAPAPKGTPPTPRVRRAARRRKTVGKETVESGSLESTG